MADDEITEQDLVEALSRLQVSDLLVQTLSTVSSLAYHRLADEHRDLEQARLAIEALRALVPVLSGSIPPELTRDFEQVTREPPARLRGGRRAEAPDRGTRRRLCYIIPRAEARLGAHFVTGQFGRRLDGFLQ